MENGGIEPPTYRMRSDHSTTELIPQYFVREQCFCQQKKAILDRLAYDSTDFIICASLLYLHRTYYVYMDSYVVAATLFVVQFCQATDKFEVQ